MMGFVVLGGVGDVYFFWASIVWDVQYVILTSVFNVVVQILTIYFNSKYQDILIVKYKQLDLNLLSIQ